ncbi:hypothetical protein, partial [uncultured Campylobacter sp.]|uniref:hypothetical protein n=1 Tax=uncultured Campylobacter sp. TaxID=218934 RepID=UPI002629614F
GGLGFGPKMALILQLPRGKAQDIGLNFYPNLRKSFAVLSFKIYVRKIRSNLIQKAANVFAKTS